MNIGNIYVANAVSTFDQNKNKVSDSLRKISSGKKINKAADDAGGLSISESFKAKARGLSQAQRNSQDGISLIQTADAALDDIEKNLHRMKEISIQAANGTLTDDDRANIDKEMQEIKKGINSVVEKTDFNEIKLLKEDRTINIQVKDNPYMQYSFGLKNTSISTMGIEAISVVPQDNALKSISKVDDAQKLISSRRTEMGSHLNNLIHSANEAGNAEVNTTSSLSGIQDVDTARAAIKLVKDGVVTQYNQFMIVGAKQDVKSSVELLKS